MISSPLVLMSPTNSLFESNFQIYFHSSETSIINKKTRKMTRDFKPRTREIKKDYNLIKVGLFRNLIQVET